MSLDGALHGVAEAAEGVRDRLAAAELGRRLGRATSTVTRRESLPVIDWPASEVLRLARGDDRLHAAVVAYLTTSPAPVRGDASALPVDVSAQLTHAAALASTWVAVAADGRVDRDELRRILAAADLARESIDALISDARAALAEVRA